MTPGPWNPSRGSGGQGLVISEATGANVAVTYDQADAGPVAAVPKMLEALRSIETALRVHPEAGVGNSVVHYALWTARGAIQQAEEELE